MSLYEKLFDYQKNIVDKFKDRDSFGLFLDMGLGKTILSLAFAEVNKCNKVIVITINAKAEESENLPDSWIGWAKQSDIQYVFHKKHSDIQFKVEQNDFLIINYESLFSRAKDKKQKVQLKQNILDFIYSCANNNVAIIVDESHKMKNLKSLQTEAIFKIKTYLKMQTRKVYSYLLTGTPFTTGYIDLYSQLKMLGYPDTKTNFIDRYCIRGNLPGLLGWQQPIVGYKNIDELYRLIHNYAITIRSEEVISLPEQIFVYHSNECSHSFKMLTTEYIKGTEVVEENKTHKSKISDIKQYDTEHKVGNPYFRNIAYPDLKWIAETNGTFWLRARELSIGFQGNSEDAEWYDESRMNSIKSFLERNFDNYVIFYNYTPELMKLFDICESLGYNVDVFCGEIKSLFFYERFCNMTESEKLVNKGNVIIANFASGSTGMNWQNYSKVIIASTPLYKDYAQAIKRVHRPGQKERVFYHIFYQKNWLDYSMQKALKEQKQYSQDMYDADLVRINQIMNKE